VKIVAQIDRGIVAAIASELDAEEKKAILQKVEAELFGNSEQ
jgi:hypothetical protein